MLAAGMTAHGEAAPGPIAERRASSPGFCLPLSLGLSPSELMHIPSVSFTHAKRDKRRRPAMTKEKTLQDLFHDTLKDIYFAEKKILSALPKMAKAAHSDELRAAFEKHEGETEGHVDRLEQVFEVLGETPKGKICDAIMGILEEGQEIMKEYKGSPALDAGLLAAAQAVEHYEISRYGTLKTWASELDLASAVKLLDATLAEEKKTDAALTEIAETVVNQEAQAA
jgi:ferritin-like metal-binding protein YciE